MSALIGPLVTMLFLMASSIAFIMNLTAAFRYVLAYHKSGNKNSLDSASLSSFLAGFFLFGIILQSFGMLGYVIRLNSH